MTTIIAITLTVLLVFLYKRYIPVYGVEKVDLNTKTIDTDNIVFLDTRDYRESCHNTLTGTYCIPLPYLVRHYNTIPNKDIILIVSDNVEKNLGARLLRRKGMRVIGYHNKNECTKESYQYEIRCTGEK